MCLCVCVIGLGATRQNMLGLLATDGFANFVADLEQCASLLAGVGALETGRCPLTGCVRVRVPVCMCVCVCVCDRLESHPPEDYGVAGYRRFRKHTS